MRINYNISSIIARNALNNNDDRLSASIERLSSGLKINHAADDSAGLAISIRMNAQIKSLEQANQNANDGISVVNTADGAMSEMHDILQRMNELSIQAANGTNADSDREQIQLEIDELVEELDRIAETTEFNAQNLLDGSFAYKGYTNTENVKVKSYSAGVASGIYQIGSVTYSYYQNEVSDYSTYIENAADGKVVTSDSYEIGSADGIKKNLITTSTSVTKAFPDGCSVILDDEDIVIKGNDNFKVTLSVNNRGAVQSNNVINTTSAPKYYTIDNYQNIIVTNADGSKKYNITDLSIKTPTDVLGAPIAGDPQVFYSGTEKEGLRNLTEDFKEAFKDADPDAKSFLVTGCTTKTVDSAVNYEGVTTTISNTVFTITYDVTDKQGGITQKSMDFTVNIPLENTVGMTKDEEEVAYAKYISNLPDKVHENSMNKYLYSHTETIETQYTIGDTDNPINLDLTGIGAMQLQVGANEGQILELEIPNLKASYLGVDDIDISTEASATESIDKITDAINQLSGIRAKIGAYSNRLEHTVTNLDTTTENMTAAYSRIMDVDMATEMTEYSTVQVLVESATAMLAQANERPQTALQLLQ